MLSGSIHTHISMLCTSAWCIVQALSPHNTVLQTMCRYVAVFVQPHYNSRVAKRGASVRTRLS